MRTGGIDTLAAPVGDLAQRHRSAEEGGKTRAGHVAIRCHRDPARDQAGGDAALAGRERRALGGFLEVQQAEIVLAALAHDGLLGALLRIGIEMRDLLHDLALEVAGVGGDPKARPVLLGPQAGGREIAERLADAGAGFDQRDPRRAGRVARGEGIRRGFGVGRLFGTQLAHAMDELREALLRFAGGDRQRAGLVGRGIVVPLRQAAPGFEAGDGRLLGVRFAQDREDHRPPAPAGARHRGGERPHRRACGFGARDAAGRSARRRSRAAYGPAPPCCAASAGRARAQVRARSARKSRPA